MSDRRTNLSRRTFTRTLALGVPGALILRPQPAAAWLPAGIVFRIVGYGMAESASLALGLVFLGFVAAAAVVKWLRGPSDGRNTSQGSEIHAAYRGTIAPHHGNSDASYAAYAPVEWEHQRAPQRPMIVRVSVDPMAQIDGETLRIRAMEFGLLRNDGIVLPTGGRLVIQESGAMDFADTKFRGSATMQNNGDIAVRTRDDDLALTRIARGGRFLTIHHDSHEGRTALTSVLGDIRHV